MPFDAISPKFRDEEQDLGVRQGLGTADETGERNLGRVELADSGGQHPAWGSLGQAELCPWFVGAVWQLPCSKLACGLGSDTQGLNLGEAAYYLGGPGKTADLSGASVSRL